MYCAGCSGVVKGRIYSCSGCGQPLCNACMMQWRTCSVCHEISLEWGGKRHLAYLKKYNKEGKE